jgi:hypothetical protein
MKEHHRLRIERLTERYARRLEEGRTPEEASFLCAFEAMRAAVVRPRMEEFAEELRMAGHDARTLQDLGSDMPNVELALGLRGGTGRRNVVGFCVIRWKGYPLQVLAYLEVNPPRFDLERFLHPAEVEPDRVEQILMDAVEHVIACNMA